MTYFIILLAFVFSAQTADPEYRELSISSSAEVQVPADIIQFNINLNAESDSPQKTYNLHKEREKVLVQLLDKYEIKEENINYQPVSISKYRDYSDDPNRKTTYQTRQQVSLTFKDFEIYEKIQVALIENDFDNFQGNFTSTEAESAKDQAIKKAIQQAKEKAQLIAKESGVELGKIRHIEYGHQQIQPYAQEYAALKAESDSGSLSQYDQSVIVRADISIKFYIQ